MSKSGVVPVDAASLASKELEKVEAWSPQGDNPVAIERARATPDTEVPPTPEPVVAPLTAAPIMEPDVVAIPEPEASLYQGERGHVRGHTVRYKGSALPEISTSPSHEGSWGAAVRSDWQELRIAPLSLRRDKEVVLAAVEQDPSALATAADALKGDRAFILQVVRIQGFALQHASEALRGDKEVVLVAIGQDPLALRYASEELRADPTVVMEAIKHRTATGGHPRAAEEELNVTPEAIREATFLLDPSIWRAKVARDWQRLGEAPMALRSDRETVLGAVRESWGEAVRLAAPVLRNDREVALEAVRLRGFSLQYVSEELRDDVEVVCAAVAQDWEALSFAGEAARSDPTVVMEAMLQSPDALGLASEAIRNRRDWILQCVREDGRALRFASEALRGDLEIALAAFRQNSLAMRWISESVRPEVWASTAQNEARTPTRWVGLPAPEVEAAPAEAGPPALPAAGAAALSCPPSPAPSAAAPPAPPAGEQGEKSEEAAGAGTVESSTIDTPSGVHGDGSAAEREAAVADNEVTSEII